MSACTSVSFLPDVNGSTLTPIRLVIEGVNSFTDAQELDFEAVGRSNLFCICGTTSPNRISEKILPTARLWSAGLSLRKSEYLPCSSRYTVLNSPSSSPKFSEGGDVYRVERVIAKKSDKDGSAELAAQGNTKELTLSKNDELVGSGGTAADAIANIVGLDEGEFKTVYLLEQGKYSPPKTRKRRARSCAKG